MPCQDYYCSSSYLTTWYYPKIHTGVTLQVSILYHCDKNGWKISSCYQMNSDDCQWWLKNVLEYLTVGWYFKKEFKENLQLQKKRYVTRYWKLMRWNLNGVTGLSFQIFINHPHTSILTIQTSTNLSNLFWRKNTNSKPQTFVLIFFHFSCK